MKNLEHEKDTSSYMQICLYLEGKGNIYLMVPTYWDAVEKNWFCFVKTPISGKLIRASGKNSKDLQDNFIIEINKSFEEIQEETLSMFKPLEYWEVRITTVKKMSENRISNKEKNEN